MKMSAEAVAHSVRWLIWAFSAVAVGAMKPLLFPEGGGCLCYGCVVFIAGPSSAWISCRTVADRSNRAKNQVT